METPSAVGRVASTGGSAAGVGPSSGSYSTGSSSLLTDDDKQNYPRFAKLLEQISQLHIAKEGAVSHSVKARYDMAQSLLLKEKQAYFQVLTVYKELYSIVRESQVASLQQEESTLRSEPHIYDALGHYLAIEEAAQLVEFPESILKEQSADESNSSTYFKSEPKTQSGNSLSLFILEKSDLKDQDSQTLRQRSQSMQNNILPELEDRLKSKCEEIADFYEPADSSEFKIAYAKSSLLHGIISKKKTKLERESRLLLLDKVNTERAFWEYFKVLAKSIDVSVEILREYRLKQQFEADQIVCKWLQEKCKTMILKLRVLKNQFLCETYTPDSVVTLQKIKNYLEVAKREAIEEHDRILVKLEEYSSIGLGFDAIVKQYSQLLEEIKNKTWAINELQQNKEKV